MPWRRSSVDRLFRPAARALAALGALLALSGCGTGDAVRSGTPTVATATPPATAVSEVEPRLRIERARLERGETLADLLVRTGVGEADRRPVLDALFDHVDPRRLPVGTGIAVSRNALGGVVSVACRTEPLAFVRARRAIAGAWSAERVELDTVESVRSFTGTVETSVAQALSDARFATALTAAYADIFQWDVDLIVEPRRGDVVRVVYEEISLGAIPEDLPPFGNGVDEVGVFGIGDILAATYEGSVASSRAYFVEDDESGGYYAADGTPLRKTFLKSPLNYRRISSRFSRARRHPITRRVVPHHGVDFAAPRGTPVVAAADGRVVSVGWSGNLGKAVRLRHGSGVETVYGHLSRFATGLRPGARVRQNDLIGYVGATGRATGPHLHYGMYRDGRAVDPMRIRNPPVEPLPDALRPMLEAARAWWDPWLRLS